MGIKCLKIYFRVWDYIQVSNGVFMRKYLFVAGCARSGTSALVQLLVGSPQVVIGMERFGHLVNPSCFTLSPEHFTKDRFLNIKDGDTFYDDFFGFHKFDPNIENKLDKCDWIGDKRPDLYESYDHLFERFPDAKVIFIHRSIEEVASSYHGRIDEGKNWPASKNFESAVREWNRSLFLTREAISKGYDINVVDYDTVFCGEKNLQPLFTILNIVIDEELDLHIKKIRGRSKQLADQRKQLLSEKEILYLKDNAKQFLIDDVKLSRVFR